MTTVFVSGVSRGIGLGLVDALVKDPSVALVIAAARKPDGEDLQAIVKSSNGKVKTVTVEITDEKSAATAAEETKRIAPEGVHVLINNAGVFPDPESLLTPTGMKNLQYGLDVNVFGTLKLTAAIWPLMTPSPSGVLPVILNVSSVSGSTGKAAEAELGVNSFKSAAYCTSKIALNGATVHVSRELRGKAIVCVVHPGWVISDMGGRDAAITPETSATGILKQIARLTKPEDTGKNMVWDGSELPW